ncbi:VWA domain-containing protein [Coraliomargarita sp. SDUM461004]|uniref:VWA domain-containing protein n=1 Tax=Thalassobacterium sedimentorum TaxID=3041258 RepID=A0ABU1AEX0_9BACT|nr:VWA domain-containing protein [Coraliomargarita sp. SDUM461004]MDQ8193214.1 VWA domain-containing protein [Coraliomargarita sp. SDUM461004]
MSFEEPIWLSLTPLVCLLFAAILAYGFRRRDALLSRFAASRLLEQLTEQASLSRTWIKSTSILLAVLAIGIALSRPQLGVEWSERKARGLDIVFVLDSSKSMLATDLRPTRLDRAKLAIIDLLERLESDRIGLVAFAGQAFLQTPPTLDYSAFRESLDAIDPGIMTSGGSDLGNAIKEAAEAFPTESNVKVVVLLTDGEDLGGHATQAAEAAQEDGIQVFAIGIGTPEGEYLKIRNQQGIEEYVRDADGQPVRSQLDEDTLQQIAHATGGSYSRLSSASLDQLYRSVIATLPREERASELQEIRIERFQWPLFIAVALLVMEILIRRRRSVHIHANLILLSLLLATTTETQAQVDSPTEPLSPAKTEQPTDARNIYNAAYDALTAGDYESAIRDYQTAIAHTDDLMLQRDALYNLGYATYQQGRSSYKSGDPQTALEQIKKAETLYQSAQEIDPEDTSIQQDLEQITAVREAIEKLIEEQQQQDDSSQDSDKSDQQDQQDQQDQESQENQSSDQDQNESQEKDQQDSQQDDQAQQSQDSQQSQQGDQSQQTDQSQQDQQSDSNQAEDSQQPQDGSETAPDSESNPAQSAEQESTQDPVDDIPQPQPDEESAEQDQSASASESAGDAADQEGQNLAGAPSDEHIQGMSEAEAAALLDSLRGKETLLPFIDQSRRGHQNDLRDW